MKKGNMLVLILVLMLALVFPTTAFGEDAVDETPGDQTLETGDELEDDEDEDLGEGKGKGNGKNKQWKEAKAAVVRKRSITKRIVE